VLRAERGLTEIKSEGTSFERDLMPFLISFSRKFSWDLENDRSCLQHHSQRDLAEIHRQNGQGFLGCQTKYSLLYPGQQLTHLDDHHIDDEIEPH
jgi:hypothetical protein